MRKAYVGSEIEVGSATNGSGTRFIAVPRNRSDRITKPLSKTKTKMTAILIDDGDVEWLIEALAVEIGLDRWNLAAEQIAARLESEASVV